MNLQAEVPRSTRFDIALARFGEWLKQHQSLIRRMQWGVVVTYAFLIVVPVLLPLPSGTAHLWNNLTLFAQFAFWGIWWPFVLVSMMLVGRLWCGLLCPEGALSEALADRGRGHAVPRWVQWRGWPFVAFACTTVYGQMTSVYQYPGPALVVLGGSTGAAMLVGYLWGRHKRVWCRYLCPVTGVFSLLSKLAPFHFRVDTSAWALWSKARGAHTLAVNCAPLVPIKTMRGANLCHMCGRCSGFRGAVTLARRAPNDEIVNVAGDRPKPWDTMLIVFGLMGLAAGAFHWSSSALYVVVKQGLADPWLHACRGAAGLHSASGRNARERTLHLASTAPLRTGAHSHRRLRRLSRPFSAHGDDAARGRAHTRLRRRPARPAPARERGVVRVARLADSRQIRGRPCSAYPFDPVHGGGHHHRLLCLGQSFLEDLTRVRPNTCGRDTGPGRAFNFVFAMWAGRQAQNSSQSSRGWASILRAVLPTMLGIAARIARGRSTGAERRISSSTRNAPMDRTSSSVF